MKESKTSLPLNIKKNSSLRWSSFGDGKLQEVEYKRRVTQQRTNLGKKLNEARHPLLNTLFHFFVLKEKKLFDDEVKPIGWFWQNMEI